MHEKIAGETHHNAPEKFSLLKRVHSFRHAGRGLRVFFRITHNAWIHAVLFAGALLLGWYFGITAVEWALIVGAGGLVFAAEAMNTAIEIDMNLTSPEYHPAAKDTKDVSAAAVLIAAFAALAIGIIVFGPHVAGLF